MTRQGQYHLFLSRPDHGLNVFAMLSILCSVCGLPLRIEDRRVSVQTRRTEVPAHVHFAGGAEEASVSHLFLGHWVLDKRQGMVETRPRRTRWVGRLIWQCGERGWVVLGGGRTFVLWSHGPIGHPSPAFLALGYKGMYMSCLDWSDLGKGRKGGEDVRWEAGGGRRLTSQNGGAAL